MARNLPVPVIVAALGVATAAVIAIGMAVGYRLSIGGFLPVGRTVSGYAKELEAQLCKLGSAVTEFSATNDAVRFNTAMREISDENRRTFTDSRHYIDTLKPDTEGQTSESHEIRRSVELLWETTNTTERLIGSAYSLSEALLKEPHDPYFGSDWARDAMLSEVLIMLMGVNPGGKACARATASAELQAKISQDRQRAADAAKERMQDYSALAAKRAAKVSADPQASSEARGAAAEDLQARDRLLSADYDGFSRKAAMRLFGVVPD